FSSRRRHTRSKRDWSSDVCSSDLADIGTQISVPKYPFPCWCRKAVDISCRAFHRWFLSSVDDAVSHCLHPASRIISCILFICAFTSVSEPAHSKNKEFSSGKL